MRKFALHDLHLTYSVSIINGYLIKDETSWHCYCLLHWDVLCVAGLAMWTQSQASICTISVGKESTPNYAWTIRRPAAVCQGELGIFEKNNLHHIEQIQPHAICGKKADDICPHINTLKIFSRLIGVRIIPMFLETVAVIWAPAFYT